MNVQKQETLSFSQIKEDVHGRTGAAFSAVRTARTRLTMRYEKINVPRLRAHI